MASLTQWTWVWVNSGSWWWTGRPGVLRFMVSQRVGYDWATELNWTELIMGNYIQYLVVIYNLKESEKEYMYNWVNSGSWWWTGRPGVLRFMGSQIVGHDWVNELTELTNWYCFDYCSFVRSFEICEYSSFVHFFQHYVVYLRPPLKFHVNLRIINSTLQNKLAGFWFRIHWIYRLLWTILWSSEKAMAPYSSTLAWKIPWTEEPSRLQSMGSQRIGHNWRT